MLVTIGWLTIYSTTVPENDVSIFDTHFFFGKQLFYIGLSLVLIIFLLAIDPKFYENFSPILYVISITMLAGLFIAGKKINGSLSWYSFGSFTLQPSEFAKVTTALFLAKYLSNLHTDLKKFKDLLIAILILAIPGILILLQPDAGSLLVFVSLTFVLYREGMPAKLLMSMNLALFIFLLTLKFGILPTLLFCIIGCGMYVFWLLRKRKKIPYRQIFVTLLLCIVTSSITPFVFDSVFKQHHRNRFSLWLRMESDPQKLAELRRDFGYNTYMAESAITSGGYWGKGFLQGTRTKGNFVPEQQTDYIFTTLAEEKGLIGTLIVVFLFTFLLLRLITLAENQRSKFSRIYGYCVVSILFIHFFVNIGMVIGILPTIGIPLPFFSYGGSGLWAFTILLFVFLRLDANRIHDWIE